jgi:RHS repeat-associated protein
MLAAKEETDSTFFPLAAAPSSGHLPRLSENSRLGLCVPTALLHSPFTLSNSNTASGLWPCGYDYRGGSRCTGKERDVETGLDYFGARYLSSAQGRWMSPDELFADQHPEDPQSWNLYGYVRNNPLRMVDDGHQAKPAEEFKLTALPDGKGSQRIQDVTIGVVKSLGRGANELLDKMGANPSVTEALDRWTMPDNARQEMAGKATDFLIAVDSGTSLAAGFAFGRNPLVVGQAFKSFDALKRALGSAGEGMVWHHIVEQSKVDSFGAEAIHNTANAVRVSEEINIKINGFYSSKQLFTNGVTVREWLKGKSWSEQYKFGKEILERAQNGQL